MEKLMRTTPQDRLSELPDSLIFLILSLLPMEDVVRTTLLSKRWKDLWTSVPCLNFREDINDSGRFQDFVNRALILWKGTKILKFETVLFYDNQPAYRDLDLWLRFAIENEVEELHVNLLNEWDVTMGFFDTEYWAPQRLFSCLSIKKLSLVGCQLEIHGNVQWDQLKCLTIDSVPLSENVINLVLSGTPQLEVLILRLMESDENLNIHSSSLKMLTIEKYYDRAEYTGLLTIWAPNVETLEILGVEHSRSVLMNVSSLTNATVGFYCDPEYYDDDEFSCYKLLEDILGSVYHSNRHVEKVTLSLWCIKIFVEMKDKLAPLSDATFLKLGAVKAEEMVDLLEIFPKLTKLVLEDSLQINGYSNTFAFLCDISLREPLVSKVDTINSLETKTDFTKPCLLHLKTVEIAWNGFNNSIFQSIGFLLKYACKLEKLVFRVKGSMSLKPETLLLTSEKLLRMPRSSPSAEVIMLRK